MGKPRNHLHYRLTPVTVAPSFQQYRVVPSPRGRRRATQATRNVPGAHLPRKARRRDHDTRVGAGQVPQDQRRIILAATVFSRQFEERMCDRPPESLEEN
jgi:hypothetical protein